MFSESAPSIFSFVWQKKLLHKIFSLWKNLPTEKNCPKHFCIYFILWHKLSPLNQLRRQEKGKAFKRIHDLCWEAFKFFINVIDCSYGYLYQANIWTGKNGIKISQASVIVKMKKKVCFPFQDERNLAFFECDNAASCYLPSIKDYNIDIKPSDKLKKPIQSLHLNFMMVSMFFALFFTARSQHAKGLRASRAYLYPFSFLNRESFVLISLKCFRAKKDFRNENPFLFIFWN